MRCPVCHERVKKTTVNDSDDILVRCATDGDFIVTAGARKMMEDVPAAARQQALNRAILANQPGQLPRIKKFMVEARTDRRAGKLASSAEASA